MPEPHEATPRLLEDPVQCWFPQDCSESRMPHASLRSVVLHPAETPLRSQTHRRDVPRCRNIFVTRNCLRFFAVALDVPLDPELMVLKPPTCPAPVRCNIPFSCAGVHTEGRAPILPEQLPEGASYSNPRRDTLTALFSLASPENRATFAGVLLQ